MVKFAVFVFDVLITKIPVVQTSCAAKWGNAEVIGPTPDEIVKITDATVTSPATSVTTTVP